MTHLIARHPRWLTLGPFVAFVAAFAVLQLRPRAVPTPPEADVPAGESADLGPLGDFAFTSKDGVPVRAADLAGKVWVVGCFFTCCTESCPLLSAALARLQEELKDESDVRLVSLTVDPANDTPQKLGQYADTYRAVTERWLFLTGGDDAVHAFVRTQLKLGVETNPNAATEPGNRVLHSPKLTLIDRRGAIRGYFDGTDAAAVGRLRDAVRRLARESP